MNSHIKTKDSLSKLRAYKLQYARVVMVAAIILYPVSGLILKYLDHTNIEFMGQRLLLSFMFAFLLFGTFKIKHIKKNVLIYLYLSCFIAIVWSGSITILNNFNFNYSIILLTGIAATASIFLNRNLTVIFLFVSTVVLCICVPLSSNIQLSPLVLPLSTTILFAVYFIRETYRQQIVREVRSLNEKLLILNSNLEQKVVERTKMLEKKNEELEKLTYIVSHDLKSPLRNIGSFASLIDKKIEKGDLESVSSYGKIISKSVDRMSTIISDLLTFGKIDQQNKTLDETHLPSLIQEIININFSSELYSNVRFTIADDFPDIIKCDYNQLSLLLENLIGNGIKYNDSTIKFIRIYYKQLDDCHQILVQDNGIGISEKYKEKIFEMFSRLHSESKYDGTGIGLSICKKIVKKHGGEINFFSEQGSGTTFCFTICKKLESKKSELKEKVN